MSLEILTCDNCKEEMSIPMGQVSACITLKKSSWCKHCHERKTIWKDYNFCTVWCLITFMSKIGGHQDRLTLDEST